MYVLVVLGQNFGGLEDAIAIAAHADHALIFFKQIRQNAFIGTYDAAPPSVTLKRMVSPCPR